MVWPVVAIAAATAVAQMYQSEKARKADKQRLDELKSEFDKLVPPQYDVSIMDPPELIKDKIPEPSFDMAGVTPEQFKVIGKYRPDIAPLVAEANPRLVEETSDGREGRSAQMDALRKLKRIGADGQGDPELQSAMSQASRRAQAEAQSRQKSVLQDAQRRGQLGSGAMLAAQLQGGSDAMDRAAMSGQDAAVASYKNRLQALRDSASLGGQVRGADMEMQGRNAAIINDFNTRGAARRQAWEQERADTLNQGQRLNLDAEQSVSNLNTSATNESKYKNLSREDALKQYLYGVRSGERDYQNNVATSQAKWRADERDQNNSLKGKQYDDQYRQYAGKQGLAVMGMDMARSAHQDKQQAIQGVGNAAMAGYGHHAQGQQMDQEQMRQDDREYFKKHGTWMDDDTKKKRYGG